MDKRGQITLEGLLIFGFFVLIFASVTFPAAMRAYIASKDTSYALEAKNNLNTISQTIKTVRNGGTGSVRTVYVISSVNKWKLEAHDSTSNKTLIYWIGWSSSDMVPSQLLREAEWGGVYLDSISGIGSGTETKCEFSSNGAGKWRIKIENNATSTVPRINISTCSAGLITIFLVG